MLGTGWRLAALRGWKKAGDSRGRGAESLLGWDFFSLLPHWQHKLKIILQGQH